MMASEVTGIHNFEVSTRATLNEVITIIAHDRGLTMLLSLRLKVHLVVALYPYLGGSSLLVKLILLYKMLLRTV
jgi:hypothetical protein